MLGSIAVFAVTAALSAHAAPAAPTLKPLGKTQVSGRQYPGSFEKAVGWRDKNGDNVVIFSARDSARGDTHERYIYATHFAGKRQLRTIKDRVDNCEFDLTASFVAGSIAVTDLDGDGLGEITFAYRLACRSDMSPSTLKLLILENGKKYIIRGTSRIGSPEVGYEGGDKKIDRSLAKGPKVFLAHANRIWSQVVAE